MVNLLVELRPSAALFEPYSKLLSAALSATRNVVKRFFE